MNHQRSNNDYNSQSSSIIVAATMIVTAIICLCKVFWRELLPSPSPLKTLINKKKKIDKLNTKGP